MAFDYSRTQKFENPFEVTPKARSIYNEALTSPRSWAPTENHSVRQFNNKKKSTVSHGLPEIIRRGPINNRNTKKKVVGISMPKRDKQPSAPKFRVKRSLQETKTPNVRKSKSKIPSSNFLQVPKASVPSAKRLPLSTFRMP